MPSTTLHCLLCHSIQNPYLSFLIHPPGYCSILCSERMLREGATARCSMDPRRCRWPRYRSRPDPTLRTRAVAAQRRATASGSAGRTDASVADRPASASSCSRHRGRGHAVSARACSGVPSAAHECRRGRPARRAHLPVLLWMTRMRMSRAQQRTERGAERHGEGVDAGRRSGRACRRQT